MIMDKVRKKYIFLITIIIIGIITGIIFSNILSNDDEKLVYDKLTNYFLNIKEGTKIDYLQTFINSIKQNTIYLVIIWLLGLSIIGLVINSFLLYIKSFVLGFSIGSIINIYLYKGIILSIIYIFPSMILNILNILILIYYANDFSSKLFNLLFLKKEIKFSTIMKRYLYILLISGGIFLISSLLETFLTPFIMKLFTFLIN